jgi:GTP-binding protein Era
MFSLFKGLAVRKSFPAYANVIMRNVRTKPSNRVLYSKEKRLDVVILGRPNAGKSVLLNRLLNVKLAATSRKRQTTRTQILGVFNHKNVQIAFFDTPGFISMNEAGKEEVRKLRNITVSAVASADVVLLLVDCVKAMQGQEVTTFCEMVKLALDGAKQEIILVLNKVDLELHKINLLDKTRELVSYINGVKYGPEAADESELDITTFMISAQENDGVIDLKNYLYSIAKPKPWLLTKDQGITDMTDMEKVEEVVLEAMLDHTHEEIPYIAGIECTTVNQLDSRKVRIDVNISVDNPRQQKIVIGHQGRTLVKVRQSAADIIEREMFADKTVLLYIWVNVRSKNNNSANEQSHVQL